MRTKVTLVIDKEIYDKAHSLGINVSKACENYLRILNQSIENTNNGKPTLLAPDSSGRSGMAGGEGFEPSTPNLGGWCSIRAMGKSRSTPHFGGCYRNIAIRTELLAHNSRELPTLNVNTLLTIEKLLIYLEGKSENTRIATDKNQRLRYIQSAFKVQPSLRL